MVERPAAYLLSRSSGCIRSQNWMSKWKYRLHCRTSRSHSGGSIRSHSGGSIRSPSMLTYRQPCRSAACRCTWRCLGVFVHFYICTINRTHILLRYYKPYFYIVFSVKPSYFDVFLFSFPTFAEKSDILDICFFFSHSILLSLLSNIIFSFQNLYEFPPCSSSLILSLSLYTIAI